MKDSLSIDYLEELAKLKKQKEYYSNQDSKKLIIECYSKEKQVEIFNLKKRKNLIIQFRNARGWYCSVDYSYLDKRSNEVVIAWHFDKTPHETHKVSLTRFIEIYRKHEFFNIAPREFYEYYFINVEAKLKQINDKIDQIESNIKN